VLQALLGDIGIADSPAYRDFLHKQADRFEQVLSIAGNHEYYNPWSSDDKQPIRTVEEQQTWLRNVFVTPDPTCISWNAPP